MQDNNSEKRRKVSFSAVPQVKFIENNNSSKTTSSISIPDMSMELTTDLTTIIEDKSTETIDLQSVVAQINNEDKNLDREKSNLSSIKIKRNSLKSQEKGLNEKKIENYNDKDKTDDIDEIFNFNNIKEIKNDENTKENEQKIKLIEETKNSENKSFDIENELFNKNDIFDNIIINQDKKIEKENTNLKKISNASNISFDFYTTKDLKKIIPENKTNIIEILEKNKIKFVDKNTISRRKTISRQNIIKQENIYYYKYFSKEFLNYYSGFIDFISKEMEKKQENIIRLENENYDVEGINFNGIKKHCRIFAMNEWYLLRIEKENEFNNFIYVNKDKLKKKMERKDLSEELNKLILENNEKEAKICVLKNKLKKETVENFKERINNIKNYFKKNSSFNVEFIDENLKRKNVLNDNKILNYLNEEIEKRKNSEKEKKIYKEKLEKELNELNLQLENHHRLNKYKNVTLEQMELEKKKYYLFLSFNKVKNLELNNKIIKFKYQEFDVFCEDKKLVVNCENNDFYKYGLRKIKKDNFKIFFKDVNELILLYKEISGCKYKIKDDFITIINEDKKIVFNLNYIEIKENNVMVYAGKRNFGMIA